MDHSNFDASKQSNMIIEVSRRDLSESPSYSDALDPMMSVSVSVSNISPERGSGVPPGAISTRGVPQSQIEKFEMKHERLRWRKIKKDMSKHRNLVTNVKGSNMDEVPGYRMNRDLEIKKEYRFEPIAIKLQSPDALFKPLKESHNVSIPKPHWSGKPIFNHIPIPMNNIINLSPKLHVNGIGSTSRKTLKERQQDIESPRSGSLQFPALELKERNIMPYHSGRKEELKSTAKNATRDPLTSRKLKPDQILPSRNLPRVYSKNMISLVSRKMSAVNLSARPLQPT